MAKSIMLMGTSSHVGKSILTTALCRIFHQQGKRVVPFKAQNMALNSYVTLDGREMGRAQVAQAEAAGLAPEVDMNPVLLKPTGNAQSQVVIMGEPVGNMSAREYHTGYSLKAWEAVEVSLDRLRAAYDLLVIEGAGSPAEINLKANDILGVIPHIDALGIDEEDSVSLDEQHYGDMAAFDGQLRIAVIRTPKLSNFTDFDALAHEPDVALYYVRTPEELGHPDLILLPGSKNTTEDLLHIRQVGLADAIRTCVTAGTPLFGICGGYQMLGERISDPLHTESEHDVVEGLGYLPLTTTFAARKHLRQVTADCAAFPFLGENISVHGMRGYEIHMGDTTFAEEVCRPFRIVRAGNAEESVWDGAVSADGRIAGTYIHGIFDDDHFRRAMLNRLRARRGMEELPLQYRYGAEKEHAYDRLAATVQRSLDMDKLAAIIAAGDAR